MSLEIVARFDIIRLSNEREVSNMEKTTKITDKEFKELLKEIEFADVKEDGYGYILLVIANDLINDALMYEEHDCPYASRRCKKQHMKIHDFLKEHGYYE